MANKMVNTLKAGVWALMLAGVVVTHSAAADVYVSPYKDDGEVLYSAPPPIKSAPQVKDATSEKEKRASSNRIAREDLGQGAAGSNGKNVPLKSALQMVYPEKAWKYNFDPDVSPDEKVSWSGGNNEGGIIQNIARQNGLYIAVNPEDNVVGVSRDSTVAHLLASRIPRVWFVRAGTDLHSLVRDWAVIAEKKVGFKVSDNYRISYPATIQGSFLDALNQLLASVADEKVPLIAKRSTNGVFSIERGGWQAP
tara:strand:+ start:23413 stop:24168 length:756 start_codon:yes stop_codon:yes gene_type:complete